MGKPLKHTPVKLIAGLIARETYLFSLIKGILEKKFGITDKETASLDFSCTDYYESELGKNLKRKFFSFKRLIDLKNNYKIKLYTNRLEYKFSLKGKRTINIDPGYISLTGLILFTTKNRSHRIYLDKGIYGDLELQYKKGSFYPLEWTYPDYRTKEYIEFFNSVRKKYLSQVGCLRRLRSA